ncbi:SixA phosphatase family protein [Streptomyces prasinopilosus]|uniref:SixA phosphatase family protein n=1 Tax=Streptomyces prasinopilosus TaxID=67344 RepID=UPI0006EB8C94|nr:histidine phosphatase family protein [Streptomyces prasinopilosus]
MTGLPGEGGPGPAGATGAAGPAGRDEAAVPRRLVVLRHAKSARPEGVPDRDRPLAARGERDAPAAGRALAAAVGPPGLVLCSTAVRARRTWELAAAEWDAPPPVRYESRLYAAGVPGLLAVVREVPAEVGTLLLVGHNPGLADLVLALAGDGADDLLDRVRTKFPTSAVAVLTWHGTAWSDLAPGTALLTSVTVPRGPAR